MSNTNRKLIDLATDPEQYTQGEATSWMVDDKRQKEQQDRFWSAIESYVLTSFHSVLDVGCGSGWIAERLFEIGIENYVGLEPSLKNFQIAKHGHPDLVIRRTTLDGYSADSTFDCVIAIMSISHVKDVKISFKKIYNLLSPEGIFISILSAFHEAPERQKRNNRCYEVEVIDEDQYVDRSIQGTGYGIADINRRPEYYIREACSLGFSLVRQTKIEDLGYSSKDLLVFKR